MLLAFPETSPSFLHLVCSDFNLTDRESEKERGRPTIHQASSDSHVEGGTDSTFSTLLALLHTYR